MCGIVALYAPRPLPQREALVHDLCDLLAHRGPDGQGLFSDGDTIGVTLGHRRLSILDLSTAATQPMRRGPLSITYNGEFYNYLEKRDELSARGHHFTSRSDTEVLLALIEEHGVSRALADVNGMFAFALWDARSRSLHLARDRFGEKPLYYLFDGERGICVVASEIKALRQAARTLDLPTPRDREVMACYLADADYEVGDATFFSTIKRVRPGEIVHITTQSDGRLTLQRELYYQLTPERCVESHGLRADARFAELLEDSLRLRLRSDVPVGACLSGGLDSSSLVCLAQRLLAPMGGTLKTFSAVHRLGDPCDERTFIDAVVEHTGVVSARIDPQTLLDEKDGPDTFVRFLRHHDEPVGGASIFAQHAVYRLAAASGVRVVLSGQGADECLTGYAGALPALRADQLRRGDWLALRRAGLTQALRLWLRRELPEVVQGAWLSWRWQRAFSASPYFHLQALAPLPPLPSPPHQFEAFSERSLLHGYLYSLLCGSSLGTILRYEDRNSMAASIESRAPFLDHRVVEHCLGRAATELVENGLTKALLRRAIGPQLPQKVRDRRDKIGFAAPESRFLLGPLRELVLSLLHSTEMAQRGLYDCTALTAHYQAAKGGAPLNSYALWKAINLELWLRDA